MNQWNFLQSDGARLRRAQFFLDRSGVILLLSMLLFFVGLYRGLFGTIHVAICLTLGLFWARSAIRRWLIPTPIVKGLAYEFLLIQSILTGLGHIANPPMSHDIPFLESFPRLFLIQATYLGCTATSAFLVLWLFRDIFARRINDALTPDRLIALAS